MLLVEDLMKMFGVTKTTVRRWCRARKIPFVKFGKRYYFEEKAIEKWIKEKGV